VATDLPFGHAADELGPGVLRSSERHTRLGGVIEELIVLNPEGGVPGFVVRPAVVGGHGSVRLVDGFSLQGQRVSDHPSVRSANRPAQHGGDRRRQHPSGHRAQEGTGHQPTGWGEGRRSDRFCSWFDYKGSGRQGSIP